MLVITGGLNDLIDHQPSLAKEIFTYIVEILGDLLETLQIPDIQCYDADRRKSTMPLPTNPLRSNEDDEMEDIDSSQGASNDATPDYQEELNQSMAADFEMESDGEISREIEYRTYYVCGGVKILPLYENLNLVVKIINVMTKRNNKQWINLFEEVGMYDRLVDFLTTKHHPDGFKHTTFPRSLAELFKKVSAITRHPKTLAIDVMLKSCTDFLQMPLIRHYLDTKMTTENFLTKDEIHAILRLTTLFEFSYELFTPKSSELFANRDDLLNHLMLDKSTTVAFINSLIEVHRIFSMIKIVGDARRLPELNNDLVKWPTTREDYPDLISSAIIACENVITSLMSTHFVYTIHVVRSGANLASKKEYVSNCVVFGSIVFKQICNYVSTERLNAESHITK